MRTMDTMPSFKYPPKILRISGSMNSGAYLFAINKTPVNINITPIQLDLFFILNRSELLSKGIKNSYLLKHFCLKLSNYIKT